MRIVTTAILLIVTLVGLLLFVVATGTPLQPPASQALVVVIVLASLIATGCFLLGEFTGNNSQVDKVWSLAPIAYVWIVVWYGGFSLRLVVMGLLVTLWGIRLSYNFWLKGGYDWKFWSGCEDYRWHVLRQKPEFQPRWKWTLFNLLFISGYQNALVLLMTLPVVVALQFSDREFNPIDTVAAVVMLSLILFESVADWQQWRYHIGKHDRMAKGESIPNENDPGFLDRGLWALSRHPNYFAEQGLWIAFYLFPSPHRSNGSTGVSRVACC
jgi:steroid 5-alpha reductase family enzyme